MKAQSANLPRVAVAGTVPREQRRALVERLPGLPLVDLPPRGPWPSQAAAAEVLFVAGLSRDELSATVQGLPDLKWIHTASSGTDRLLVPDVVERRLRLSRTAHARAEPMAEHVLAMALALTKNVPARLADQRRRRWGRREAGTLRGARIVILGAGAVGRAAARGFRALGAMPAAITRRPSPMAEFDTVLDPTHLSTLLRSADVVTVACALTPETRHMLGREQFAAMKDTAYLVNVARGAIVVEPDLVEALEVGALGGAALDVFEREPLPPDSPLWRLPNVIVSPHASGAVPGVWDAVTAEFAANLERWSASLPLANEVHPDEVPR